MIQVRPGQMEDYSPITAYDDFIGDRRLDLQAGKLTVADVFAEKAVGYSCIDATGFLGWPLLSNLCVHPDFRGKGVGTALLRAAQDDARFIRVYTSTEAGNHTMLTLLEKVSARQIGTVDELNISGERELLFRLK